MKNLLRFLRPMRILRRRALTKGLFGGDRFWLIFGGLAWVGRWFGKIFGTAEPTLRYSGAVGAGERVVLVHEPDSPLQKKKFAKASAKADASLAKLERKQDRKALKAARKAARRD